MKLLQKMFLFGGAFVILSLTSCSKKQIQIDDSSTIKLQLSNAEENQLIDKPQTWHVTNKRVCVLLGYGFNNKTTEGLVNKLGNKYGLDENGGLIYPLVYPDSFRHGARGFSNDFYLELKDEEKDYVAVVIIGAPERTHIALGRNQDFWKQQVPYPVVAIFPQDDDLGIEATCDIVIDKVQVADMTGAITEENSENSMEEVEEILFETIDYLLCMEGSFEKNVNLQKHIEQMVKNKKYHRYSDSETGLQSINHFVLY